MSLFLVERYLPMADLVELSATVASAAKVCDDQRKAGASLRYLHSTYVPGDDTSFCVFEAESAEEVNVKNVDMDFRVDRISPAVSFVTGHYSSSTTRRDFVANPRKRLL